MSATPVDIALNSQEQFWVLTVILFVVFAGVGLIARSLYKKTFRKLRLIKSTAWQKKRPRPSGVFKLVRPKELAIVLCLGTLLLSQAFLGNSGFDNTRQTDTETEAALDDDYSLSGEETKSNAFIKCRSPYIIDGDTFSCSGARIRLHAIDAPEMPGHCREGRRCTQGNPHKAKSYLQSLTRGEVICETLTIDRYNRTIADCTAGDINLSCEMVAAGYAVERYGTLSCGSK